MYPALLCCSLNIIVGTGFIDFPPGNSIIATVFNYAVKLVPLWIQTDVLANSSGMKPITNLEKCILELKTL